MRIIIDSSVWIDFFRGTFDSSKLKTLIRENVVATNELILAELIPFLKMKNQNKLIYLLSSVFVFELNIDWNQIVEYQYRCLKTGINGIGIPDLIIAQNAIQNDCMVYSRDQHFSLLENAIGLKIQGWQGWTSNR